MYYSYTHPAPVDVMRQEEYDLLFAQILDGLGISELSLPVFRQMDVTVRKERIARLVSASSPDMDPDQKDELVDCLHENIFASLDGSNFADNQGDFIPLRSCSGQLEAVVADYMEKNPSKPITDLSVIGTMDARDFRFLRSSMSHLLSLDLSDAIPVGSEVEDCYVIPDKALFREDGAMKMDLLNLHDSTLKIGAEAFRDCRNLDILFLSKTTTEIGAGAFRGCSSLSKVVLPKTIKSIGDGAFAECDKLKSVLCIGPVPASLGSGSFERKEDSRLVVPIGSVDEFSLSPWSAYFVNLFEDNMGDMDNYRKIKEVRKNHIGYSHDEKRAVIRLMQAMSYSDNMPHYSEEVLIQGVGVKTFDLTEQEVAEAKSMDIQDAIRQLIRMTPDKKEDFLRKVQLVAEADGGFTAGEKALYQILKNKL